MIFSQDHKVFQRLNAVISLTMVVFWWCCCYAYARCSSLSLFIFAHP